MPPALSDEGFSQSSGDEEIPAKAEKKSKSTPVEDEDENEDEEDEEVEEYVVEEIVGHKTVKGAVVYHVKWQGYDDPQDVTWEGEANLAGTDALAEYHTSIGGKPEAGKKRKGRKSAVETETSTPVAAKRMKKEKEWAPPPGSWEDDVDHVDTVEQRLNPKTGENEKFGYLVWSNQIKTQHPLSLIFKKCPQRMLAYFEQHLVFNQTEPEETNGNVSMTGVDEEDDL